MEEIGPVQLIAIGFGRDANFEGKVIEELAKLESERTIRVLDLLFIARDTDSEDTVVLEHPDAADLGGIVGALLGFQFDGDASAESAGGGGGEDHHAFGFSQDEIQQMAAGLGPGESAGILLIEHVWARDLRKAFRGVGGRILGEGFLTPETIRAVEPELAAISDAIAEMEREGAPA
ncbi:MAG TPA: hypothetical protein VJT68_11360 [Thermoleophilaceae bacterium]|nr:hypothetical protein [Thermoleophilaceae bacterium]